MLVVQVHSALAQRTGSNDTTNPGTPESPFEPGCPKKRELKSDSKSDTPISIATQRTVLGTVKWLSASSFATLVVANS